LQLRHIFLTEAATFMALSLSNVDVARKSIRARFKS
jgi:hypothetical protein